MSKHSLWWCHLIGKYSGLPKEDCSANCWQAKKTERAGAGVAGQNAGQLWGSCTEERTDNSGLGQIGLRAVGLTMTKLLNFL